MEVTFTINLNDDEVEALFTKMAIKFIDCKKSVIDDEFFVPISQAKMMDKMKCGPTKFKAYLDAGLPQTILPGDEKSKFVMAELSKYFSKHTY